MGSALSIYMEMHETLGREKYNRRYCNACKNLPWWNTLDRCHTCDSSYKVL